MFFKRLQSTTTTHVSLYLYSPISTFPFSTLEIPSNYISNQQSETHVKNPNNIDESCILNQLSDILPINRDPLIFQPITGSLPDKHLKIRAVDDFLAPEEKLRGIFLHKLRSKTAIRNALSSVGVEVSMDVFSEVVNRGNLCGEAMVMFFDWAIEQPNIPNDICTYHIILKALGRRKFFMYMMEILNDMRAKEVNPNPKTLFIVLDSYVRARQVSKAIKIFGDLEKYGLKVNVETLNVILQCLCQRSFVGTASSLFNRMKEKVQPDSETYNIIIGGWSKFGRVSEVEKFLKVMVNDGVEHDCVTYSYILEGLGRSGRVDNAVKIFEYFEEKRTMLSTGVYNAMVFNFIAVGDIDEGLKYYKRMLSNNYEPNMDTYARIIAAFLKVKRVSDAIELFDEMLARGIIPTAGTLTTFIEPLCGYGPPHAALMIYNKARKVGCRISLTAYKLLLMRLSRFGKCGMLLNIWEEMQESGYSCDVQAYEYVINGLCNTGQLETAVLVMEESLHKGFFPCKLICSKLNNKLLASNKVEIAYKLFLKLKNARVNENAQRYWRAKGWHF
ncbi:pentatricopeptide repeat-containing At5g43820 [Olea europaea subsp. europaea]|uniref:Pentatricopeptide repeat-containing At5g43820 n=1 Tax=Olea europaea subsp. europaea TaxID=158383 RepID=A0A8S0T6P4_OLEEU|nr:pentatricopeptide repeat-containing At5g43820 [Olea europaea subsp. europaea]